VKQIGAERVVIDWLSGFEIALAPAFCEDLRRWNGALPRPVV
jgi:hypothetical protein